MSTKEPNWCLVVRLQTSMTCGRAFHLNLTVCSNALRVRTAVPVYPYKLTPLTRCASRSARYDKAFTFLSAQHECLLTVYPYTLAASIPGLTRVHSTSSSGSIRATRTPRALPHRRGIGQSGAHSTPPPRTPRPTARALVCPGAGGLGQAVIHRAQLGGRRSGGVINGSAVVVAVVCTEEFGNFGIRIAARCRLRRTLDTGVDERHGWGGPGAKPMGRLWACVICVSLLPAVSSLSMCWAVIDVTGSASRNGQISSQMPKQRHI